MIITNGYNVYPEIIENEIDKVAGVQLSCVIGIPDERRGQKVIAYVVPQDTARAAEAMKKEIMDALRKAVAAYALPKEIIFREDLPKTLVGKVAYHVLEEEVSRTGTSV